MEEENENSIQLDMSGIIKCPIGGKSKTEKQKNEKQTRLDKSGVIKCPIGGRPKTERG